jgi:hypothetical protein
MSGAAVAVAAVDGSIVQSNVVLPLDPVASVAVTVTMAFPGVVGVPVIDPVLPSIESPAGSPVAL